MLKIGLTGGIGSGKTTVSDQFQRLHVPVIDTDLIARELVQPGSPAVTEIVNVFGAEAINANGAIDRNWLRQQVFSDCEARGRLESILHPRIRTEIEHRLKTLQTPYCVIVIPLLVETGFDDLVDRILVVDAPIAKRVQWTKQRSGISEAEILKIVAAQASREQHLAVAHDAINNDTTIEDLQAEVEKLHKNYLDLAKRASNDTHTSYD